ncbi:MAG: hypothetical protein HC854_18035 [Flavobacterium sp.]|nr:hypothetical protein [Flavobacterium sp.]
MLKFAYALVKKNVLIILNPQIMIQKTTLLRITKFTFCLLSVILLFSVYSFKAVIPINAIEETVPFDQTDIVPVFKGCNEELSRRESIDCFNLKMSNHVKKQFRYPKEAFQDEIQGKVEIYFYNRYVLVMLKILKLLLQTNLAH